MNETILLVDDLKMFLEIEKDFFRYADVDVMTARDGAEALELVRKRTPDLVFMDLQMPIMDGATCCRKMKSDPQLSKIPVVMISSSSSEEDRESCLAAGCDYFLTKPAGRDRFLETARRFIPDIDRRQVRQTCSYDCTIRSRGRIVRAALCDVSQEGAFVATNFPVTPHEVVQLEFALPDGTTIDCSARIIWANDASLRRPTGFGVKFALLHKNFKAALADHLDG